MGIHRLLPLVHSCVQRRRISEYRGKTAAVDTYCWLHKIMKANAGKELVKGGIYKYRFVKDCLRKIEKFRKEGLSIIMVLDGGPLPRKKDEELERQAKRKENLAKGKQMLDLGDEAGYQFLAQAIDISPDLVSLLLVELKKENIPFIVAPYEADAQLAYLSRENIVDLIITEDSDLMAFGAKRMLYKVDIATMTCDELTLESIRSCPNNNFTTFTHCMFLTMCILASCDYLKNIKGISIQTAYKGILRTTTLSGFLDMYNNKPIPHDYVDNFMKAFLTFRFQRVYCPSRKQCVEINNMDILSLSIDKLEQLSSTDCPWSQQVINLQVLQYVRTHEIDYSFLGEKYSDSTIQQIASGQIHPETHLPYQTDFDFSYVPKVPLRANSLLQKVYLPAGTYRGRQSKKQSLHNHFSRPPAQRRNPFANYLNCNALKDNINLEHFHYSQEETHSLTEGIHKIKHLAKSKGPLKFDEKEEDSLEEQKSQTSSLHIISRAGTQQSSSIQEIPGWAKQQCGRQKDQYRSQVTRPIATQNSFEAIAERFFGNFFSQQQLANPFGVI